VIVGISLAMLRSSSKRIAHSSHSRTAKNVLASSNLAKSSKKRSVAGSARIEVSASNHTTLPTPRVPFRRIAEYIFDGPYTLSIAMVPARMARVLNAKYRDQSYSPNVLSFPLSDKEGEIILNLEEARRQFRSGGVNGTWTSWIALLVIHSMLHLNGMRHGRTMEAQLENTLRAFGFRASLHEPHTHGASHHHRN
jgi:rRNA maturation RNase YbeY